MKKIFKYTALALGASVLLIVIVIGVPRFYALACALTDKVTDKITDWQMHGLELPETGQWKNDELNLILDYDTGLGTLKTDQGDIICKIGGEYNTTIFRVYVYPPLGKEYDMPRGTIILSGYYKVIEEDRIGIREYDTDIMYWFYRIS